MRRTAIADPRNVHAGRVISDVGGYYDGQSIVVAKGSVSDQSPDTPCGNNNNYSHSLLQRDAKQ